MYRIKGHSKMDESYGTWNSPLSIQNTPMTNEPIIRNVKINVLSYESREWSSLFCLTAHLNRTLGLAYHSMTIIICSSK